MAWNRLLAFVAAATMLSACTHLPSGTPPGTHATGSEVAAALNARYNDVRSACDGNTKAAYFCSGVLIRGTSDEPGYLFWNADDEDDYYGVSFSYLRQDVGSRELYRTTGFILSAADSWGQGDGYTLDVKCSYPFSASTSGGSRGPYGCGAHKNYPADSGPCFDQGIVTAPAFAEHYRSVAPDLDFPPTGFILRAEHECSFGVDPFSFELSIIARQGGELEIPYRRYMELMIAEWPRNIPGRLPVEALFYVPDINNTGLPVARKNQIIFREATGRDLPIMRVNAAEGDPSFSYREEDQTHASR